MNEHLKLGIKLRKFNRICPITGYREESIKIGSPVIVQTDRGVEFGEIVSYARGFPRALSRDVRLKKVVRYATAEDVEKEKELTALESRSIAVAGQKAKEHELPIRVINIEYLFDNSRVIVYYRSGDGEKAPNLRDLSRDLAVSFSARVDMKQVSPRDEARLFGGLGACGRSLCCSVWLDKPKHVTVKMVKEQGLAMSPTKTAGVCGRLMCCLEYEHEKK
ncbi:MAG: regulatory iron-sulfur-containing complex subunit RicT [Candidatus Margulisbacteria bacterium]|nr:regulatory iron-sulfur-containing complex subunit RicT [Candidatus Margulisiibacteriota bacterium]